MMRPTPTAGLVIAGFLLAATAVPAWACGNPLLYAMLFSKYPDAKTVYDAELEGRKNGLLSVPVFPGTPGLGYHAWALRETTDVATAMNATITSALPDGESFTVLLADDVHAVRFSANQQAPEILSMQAMGWGLKFDAYSTTSALRAIQEKRLDWDEAVRLKLVVTIGSRYAF